MGATEQQDRGGLRAQSGPAGQAALPNAADRTSATGQASSAFQPEQTGAMGHPALASEQAPSNEQTPADNPTCTDRARVSILLLPGADEAAAEHLGRALGIEPISDTRSLDPGCLIVRFDAEGVALEQGKLIMRADLTSMAPRLRPDRLHRELLVRAAKIRSATGAATRLRAVDATAGLGEDALLLAAAGFEVQLYERDPVIAALLADGLRRVRLHPQLAEAAGRMHLAGSDSIAALPGLDPTPDVVYLDPMFPERRKSAAVKKKFQLLHQLERPCEDPEALVRAALAAHPRKVIVKRPIKGPYLADIKPSYTLAGKTVRYDCIVPAR